MLSINKQTRTKKWLCYLLCIGACYFNSSIAQEIAVAIGDSFISGEGASPNPTAYLSVEGHAFPGWVYAQRFDPYFCHRSPNSAIFQANTGLQAFNFACSGAQPTDVLFVRWPQDGGRGVQAQVERLREVALVNQVRLIQVGLGANNSIFTFGGEAGDCMSRFFNDAYHPADPNNRPCSRSTMPSTNDIDNASIELQAAVESIINMMNSLESNGQQLYPPGSYRIVLQDYTNPIAPEFHRMYHREAGRSDGSWRFTDLALERYMAGCPVHMSSLSDTHWLSQQLGRMVATARQNLAAAHPNQDIIYLNVQNAFNGARLCEAPNSPHNAMVTPFRMRLPDPAGFPLTKRILIDRAIANGIAVGDVLLPDNPTLLKSALKFACGIDTAQNGIAQGCQESLHPNQAGHATLARCLEFAAIAGNTNQVSCSRNAITGTLHMSLIEGPNSLKAFSPGEEYYVSLRPGTSVASWSISNGLQIVSGGGSSNSITVRPKDTVYRGQAKVTVRLNNGNRYDKTIPVLSGLAEADFEFYTPEFICPNETHYDFMAFNDSDPLLAIEEWHWMLPGGFETVFEDNYPDISELHFGAPGDSDIDEVVTFSLWVNLEGSSPEEREGPFYVQIPKGTPQQCAATF